MHANTYELLYLSRAGDEFALSALFDFCYPIIVSEVNTLISKYQPLRIYRDDFIQECRISVCDTVERYREDKDTQFTTFLITVIRRKLINLIRHYSRPSKVQIHDTVSLDAIMTEKGSLYDCIESKYIMENPVYSYRMNDAYERVKKVTEKLLPMEKKVMDCWMNGMNYEEASKELGISYKSYDGHMQRLRSKLRKAAYNHAY